MNPAQLKVNWETVTWSQLIQAIRDAEAEESFAAPAGSVQAVPSLCEIREGIGLCDDCGKPKWPQRYMGYGCMVCLDCLAAAERKAPNDQAHAPVNNQQAPK